MSNVIDIHRKKLLTHKFKAVDSDDRIKRIRASLEKINILMADLKKQEGRNKYDV